MRTCTIAAAATFALASTAFATSIEWSVNAGGNGHWYEAFSAPLGITWEAARDEAVLRGGYLATLTSQAENDFVFQAVANDPSLWFAGTFGPWLGGLQPAGTPKPASNWQWVTGEVWSYTNWGIGEPNDAFGALDETYLHFDNFVNDPIPGSLWNDYRNDTESPIIAYIVEYPVPAPSVALSLGTFAGMLASRRRR